MAVGGDFGNVVNVSVFLTKWKVNLSSEREDEDGGVDG
jgi:hypothetical protein